MIYPGRADHPQADIIAKQMTGGSTLICLRAQGRQGGGLRASQNALEIVLISNNLGDAKSLITHPATTTHKNLTDEARAELGIGPGTLRFRRLEDLEDCRATSSGRSSRHRPDRTQRRLEAADRDDRHDLDSEPRQPSPTSGPIRDEEAEDRTNVQRSCTRETSRWSVEPFYLEEQSDPAEQPLCLGLPDHHRQPVG